MNEIRMEDIHCEICGRNPVPGEKIIRTESKETGEVQWFHVSCLEDEDE